MPTKKSWTLSEKVTLISDFEKSGMSKSDISKMHSVPKSMSNTILSTKEAIFNSYQFGCKHRMQATNFDDV